MTNQKIRMRTLQLLVWLLPIGGIICSYYASFCAWNTSFQPAIYVSAWRMLAFKWAIASAVIGVVWISSAVWLFRKKQRGNVFG
jgi:hypothetical protein